MTWPLMFTLHECRGRVDNEKHRNYQGVNKRLKEISQTIGIPAFSAGIAGTATGTILRYVRC